MGVARTFRVLLPLAAMLLAFAAAPALAGAAVPWQKFLKAEGGGRINDIVGPDSKNRLTISAGIHLWRVGRNHKQVQFVKPHDGGRLGYLPDRPKFEHYIAQVPPVHCGSFATDDIWGISGPRPRLVRITRKGVFKRGVSLPANLEPTGIVFDTVGDFGFRLLVTESDPATGATSVWAIGCPGLSPIQVVAPQPFHLEGGLAIAPPGFGAFGGWLLGTDEGFSSINGASASGAMQEVFRPPGVPIGGDVGLESLAAVPPGLDATSAAYISDRRTPGNEQPGNGLMLTVGWPALESQGVQAGDVLATTEGGALTYDIRCNPGCSSFPVAYGQPDAHVEGHLVFAHRLAKVR
jgi:hypothetical protein